MHELLIAAYTVIFISRLTESISSLRLALSVRQKNRSRDAIRVNNETISYYKRRVVMSPVWPVQLVVDVFETARQSFQK